MFHNCMKHYYCLVIMRLKTKYLEMTLRHKHALKVTGYSRGIFKGIMLETDF